VDSGLIGKDPGDGGGGCAARGAGQGLLGFALLLAGFVGLVRRRR
jgi:hypothetical protein